jgi:hypothetical protein
MTRTSPYTHPLTHSHSLTQVSVCLDGLTGAGQAPVGHELVASLVGPHALERDIGSTLCHQVDRDNQFTTRTHVHARARSHTSECGCVRAHAYSRQDIGCHWLARLFFFLGSQLCFYFICRSYESLFACLASACEQGAGGFQRQSRQDIGCHGLARGCRRRGGARGVYVDGRI